jgi:hypothetical protein
MFQTRLLKHAGVMDMGENALRVPVYPELPRSRQLDLDAGIRIALATVNVEPTGVE